MSVWESVDLPEPLGPITACTSPLLMASVTPFRISLPSTLARRSRISKSANSLLLLLYFVRTVRRRLGHPGRAAHGCAQEALIHLLLVVAGQPGAGGDVLDRAVAVADRGPTPPKLPHLGPLAGARGQLPPPPDPPPQG